MKVTCPRCGKEYANVPEDRPVVIPCKPKLGGCGYKWRSTPTRAVAVKAEAKMPSTVSRSSRPIITEIPRLVLGIDATASRVPTWDMMREQHSALFLAVPGGLEVALAVHGGGDLHTFTEPDLDVSYISDWFKQLDCIGGETCIAAMMRRAMECERVKIFLYVGDHIEDVPDELIDLSYQMAKRGTRIVILHECATGDHRAAKAGLTFRNMAKLTGGMVLPFDASAPQRVRELLEAIAVVAAEGRSGLETRRAKLKGAEEVLRLLPPDPSASGSAGGGKKPTSGGPPGLGSFFKRPARA